MDKFEGVNPKYNSKIISVYKLVHCATGMFYIGSTGNFRERRKNHVTALRSGNHPVKALQELYNKSPHFVFELIAVGVGGGDVDARENAYDHEQELLDKHWGDSLLLNKSRNARKPELSEESEKARLDKVREAHLRPEVRKRRIQALIASRQTPEARAQQSEISKEKWKDPAHRERMKGIQNDPDYLRRQVENQPTSKRVVVAGQEYASVSQASATLGISRNTIKQRIKDPTYQDYYFT